MDSKHTTGAAMNPSFTDLVFHPHPIGIGGTRAVMKFGNGYAASVVQGHFTQGGNEGLYELAVMDDDGVCYSTPITDDVIGYLTEADVTKYLRKIAKLPQRETTT